MNVHLEGVSLNNKETQGKKAEILEAATQVISRKGYYQARPQDIAEEANVSVGTIYNYFESKQDILLEIFAREFEDREKFYEELSDQDLPLLEKIKRILERHFSKLASHKAMMRVIVQERFKPESKLGRKLNSLHEKIVHYIEELIDQALDRGQIRPCNPSIVASALFGAVQSTVAYGTLSEDSNEEEFFEQAPEELAEFFWCGLRGPGSRGED